MSDLNAFNTGYTARAFADVAEANAVIFIKSINWKTILKKYFESIKVEILSADILEEDFIKFLHKKELLADQIRYFTLGATAPTFLSETYHIEQVVEISENLHATAFVGDHLALHFKDDALVTAYADTMADRQPVVDGLKAVFQDIVIKVAAAGQTDKQRIVVNVADCDVAEATATLAQQVDLKDDSLVFVVATTQPVNAELFNQNLLVVESEDVYAHLQGASRYYNFSHEFLSDILAANAGVPVVSQFSGNLDGEVDVDRVIDQDYLLQSSYLSAEGSQIDALTWFQPWADNYNKAQALKNQRDCYIFGLHPWEESKPEWWNDFKVITIGNTSEEAFRAKWSLRLLGSKNPKLILWGKQAPEFLKDFVAAHHIDFENIVPDPATFDFNKVEQIYVYGQHPWAKHLASIIVDKELVFLQKPSMAVFNQRWLPAILNNLSTACILSFDQQLPKFLNDLAQEYSIQFIYFGQGLQLSASQKAHMEEQPFAYFLDLKAPFTSTSNSDLENLLLGEDFSKQKKLVQESSQLIRDRVSAFDALLTPSSLPEELLGTEPAKVLVTAANVRLSGFSSPELIRIAQLENPDAIISYLPATLEDGKLIAKHFPLVELLPADDSIAHSLQGVKQLYTTDSLLGYEALLRGIKVVTFGQPFYAGWGLTDDRVFSAGRGKVLSVEELFTGFNLLYTRYFNPVYKKTVSYQDALKSVQQLEAIYQKESQVLELRQQELLYRKQQAALQAAEKKKPPVKKVADDSEFPAWYNPYVGAGMQKSLDSDKPVFLYIPWIAEHGNTLIARIRSSEYELVPLDFIEDLNQTRREVFRFARSNPDQYRRMIARRLVPLRNRISGVILTFDWAPVMRIIFGVCEELNIPRILIPHESVFVDRTKYYWDPFAKASRPVADVILGWGGLQRDIFLERGYPQDRFLAVGAPKFDPYANYQSQLSRSQFCRLFGLRADRKIILFASQPLDSQLDHKVARESQRQAVADLLDYCEEHGHQLLMRLPPSKDDILGKPLRDRLTQSEHGAVDDAVCYLVGAEEALFHCDLVTSVNSTMLFEGVLVGRPALSMKYIDFEQIWEGVGIPAAHNREETYSLVSSIFSQGWQPTTAQMTWAAEMFSNGAFDGLASQRIRQYLESVATRTSGLQLRPSPSARLFNADATDATIDLIGLDFTHPELKKIRSFAAKLFNAADVVDASLAATDISKVSSVDIYLQWGQQQDLRQREVQQALGKERLIIEDGLLVNDRTNSPFRQKLSISFDDGSSWLEDSGLSSRLVNTLQSEVVLKRNESTRVTKLINRIVDGRLSRHNHYPDVAIKLGSAERPKLLLIDNISAKADAEKVAHLQQAFKDMLREAIAQYPDYDILVKTELPKTRYLSLNVLAHLPHVYFIDFNIHTRSLLDIAEKVFVVNAAEGFEALLLGKEVHCYGKPFYAGWGLTTDHVVIPERTAKRSVKEVFHFAYLVNSRYYLPTEDRACELEELVDYMLGTGS